MGCRASHESKIPASIVTATARTNPSPNAKGNGRFGWLASFFPNFTVNLLQRSDDQCPYVNLELRKKDIDMTHNKMVSFAVALSLAVALSGDVSAGQFGELKELSASNRAVKPDGPAAHRPRSVLWSRPSALR